MNLIKYNYGGTTYVLGTSLLNEEQYKTDCDHGDCNQNGEKIIGFKTRLHGL